MPPWNVDQFPVSKDLIKRVYGLIWNKVRIFRGSSKQLWTCLLCFCFVLTKEGKNTGWSGPTDVFFNRKEITNQDNNIHFGPNRFVSHLKSPMRAGVPYFHVKYYNTRKLKIILIFSQKRSTEIGNRSMEAL